jgi:hypothetical protein
VSDEPPEPFKIIFFLVFLRFYFGKPDNGAQIWIENTEFRPEVEFEMWNLIKRSEERLKFIFGIALIFSENGSGARGSFLQNFEKFGVFTDAPLCY